MTEQQLINIFNPHFDIQVASLKCDCGIDAAISLRADSQVRAYILCKNNINNEGEWKTILEKIRERMAFPDSRYYREGGAAVCGNIDLLRIK